MKYIKKSIFLYSDYEKYPIVIIVAFIHYLHLTIDIPSFGNVFVRL